MNILFTGASSFTGYWFVKELAAAGHRVTATFQKPLEEYTGVRRQRINQLLTICKPIFSCPFGTPFFLELIRKEERWDSLCHHAADVTDYKSPNFDFVKALNNNTHNLKAVLQEMKAKDCHQIVLTGSVFEQNEGIGSDNLRAVSPYGLSKGLTSAVFSFMASVLNLPLKKFVIPNPFGPYEESRFTTFLIQKWLAGQIAEVNSPDYVRDNIHVSLLAMAYRSFVEKESQTETFYPSGYVESQGAFTQRFAEEMRLRMNLPCDYLLHNQKEFPEPKIRINKEKIDQTNWSEAAAWDDLASYYKKAFSVSAQEVHK